jgi:large subunit ribosomal protein L32
MPAVPKGTSRTKKLKRRSHDRVKLGSIILCSHCRRPHLSHHVCPNCGFYAGREVITEEPRA